MDPRGLYRKYIIERTDGSSAPGRKHEKCSYFVLDLVHDPFALPALRAYAVACRATHPALAAHLGLVCTAHREPPCGCHEAACPHVPLLGETPNEAAKSLMLLHELQPKEGA